MTATRKPIQRIDDGIQPQPCRSVIGAHAFLVLAADLAEDLFFALLGECQLCSGNRTGRFADSMILLIHVRASVMGFCAG